MSYMIDFNKWKLLSFGLMAILATGLLAPQAFATAVATASSTTNTTIQNILTIVTNIQTTDNAIKAKTDNLPVDPASNTAITNAQNNINRVTIQNVSSAVTAINSLKPQSLLINRTVTAYSAEGDLCPNSGSSSDDCFILLPAQNNEVYSGHISLNIDNHDTTLHAEVFCSPMGTILDSSSRFNGNFHALGDAFGGTTTQGRAIEADFTCQNMAIWVYSTSTNPSTTFNVLGAVEYTTNVPRATIN